ncbi:neugrin [Diretmus argenteus]
MPIRVLSLVSRLGALAAMPTVSARSCRFASRDAKAAWMGQSSDVHRASDRRQSHRVSDEDLDMEDEEEKLQALIDGEMKRQRTVKYHLMRRKMTPSGAPERKLSWDAVNQIRYLKEEQPEEWTVERLAEGFSVTPDVILRVLRSKFIPTPERKAQQDAKVMARLGQQVLSAGRGSGQDMPRLLGDSTPALLSPGSTASALVTAADRTLMPRDEGSRSLVATAGSSAPLALQPTQLSVSSAAAVTTASTEDHSAAKDAFEEESELEEEEEESWDGQVFSENELEELMLTVKPSPVVQVGKDFLDTEGNLLYRI